LLLLHLSSSSKPHLSRMARKAGPTTIGSASETRNGHPVADTGGAS
jgi:hypothetical protein